jgi:large repetitive protein
MRGMTSMRWLAVGIAAVIVGGCKCGTDPDANVCGIVVTFDSPKDNDDVGTTLDVTITATRDGGAVQIDSATLAAKLTSSGADFGPGRTGTVSGNRVTFSGVTLEAGENLIKASVQSPGVGALTECTGSGSITVTAANMMTGEPDVTSFTFQGDANNDKVINADEAMAAGNKITAVIATTRAFPNCTVSVVDQGNNAMVYGPSVGIPANGIANVDLTMLTNPMEGTYNLQAIIECTGMPPRIHNIATDVEAKSALRVDRVKPTCNVTAPVLVGPAQDDDPLTPGFQIRVQGTGGGAATFELTLMGGAMPQTSGAQSPMNDTLLHDFTIPAAGATVYMVQLIARDSAGNTCAAGQSVETDFVPPVVTITSPTQAGSPYAMFMIPVTAMVTDQGNHANGQNMVCTSSLGNIGGPFPVMNDMATGMGSFMAGMQTITCTVTDAAGNTSAPATQMINVTGGTGCPLTFTAPAMSPATLTRSNGVVANNMLNYTFGLTTSAACSGRAISLHQVVGMTRNLIGMANASGTGAASIPAMLADSGGMTLTFEGSISDGVNPPTMVTQLAIVSLQSPTIITPPAGILNVAQDLAAGTPGVQRSLTYQPSPPAGTTTTICSDVSLSPDAGTCPDGVGFVYQTNVATPAASFTFRDGMYSLKPVFVTGGSADHGPFVAYVVDSVRPAVATVTFTGDANNDKVLNATELPTGNPVMNVTFTGVENGRGISVVNRADSAVVGTGTVTNNAGAVTLSLGLTGSSDTSFDLEIRVTDAANNPNNPAGATPATAVDAAAFVTVRVDRVAPSCAFTAPTKTQLGIADDADAAAMNYQLRATVSTSGDVSGNMGVSIALGGGASSTVSGTPMSGLFTNDFTVSNAGEIDYTLTATCRDTAGNVTTSPPLMVRVDNVAPSACMLTAPSGMTVFSNPAITTTVVAANANGLVPVISSTAGGGGNLPPIASGSSSAVISYRDGQPQTVTATITDLAGNSCSATQVINVMSAGCNVEFTTPATNPASLNKSNDAMPASMTTLEYTLVGSAPNCPNAAVRLFRGVPGTQVDMVMTNGTGGFSFNISVPQGTERFEARMDNGVQPTFDAVDLTVDLTDPMVSGVTPSGATLFFVAPGNENARQNVAGYVVDTNPGLPGAQVTVGVTAAGAQNGTVTVLYQNNPISGPTAVTMDPQTLNFNVTLPHDSMGSLIVRVRDAAGNQVDTTSAATVDVVAPADPVLTANLIAGQERTARYALSWTAAGDDGASGTVAGYDVRWTTVNIAPTGLATSADFFDSSKAYVEANTLMATARSVTVPPLNSYFFYVRAKDEVGNYSGLVAATQQDNLLTKQTYPNPRVGGTAAEQFGAYLAAGRIDSDAFTDLVVGVEQPVSGTPANAFYIYWGSANGLSATPQTIPPYDGSTTGRWGTQVSVGHASSPTTNDVLIGAFGHAGTGAGTPAGAGIAMLYFGGAGMQNIDTSAANYVQFSGTVMNGIFGRGLAIVPDINGDGFDEILIAAPNEGTNRAGNVYMWYGRSAAAWKAMAQPILSSTADRIFQGPTPAALGTGRFGRRGGGFTNAGRAGSTGLKDLAVPESFELYNSLYIFAGGALDAGTQGMTYTTSGPAVLQTLAAPTMAGDSERGFGARAIGDVDVVSGAATDLVVSYPARNEVHVFADRTAMGFPAFGSAAFTINEPMALFFGNDFQVADWNGDGRPELFVGSYSSSTPVSTTGLFIYPNRAMAGSEFDTAMGTRFFRTRIAPLAGGSSMGTGVAVGDFNNDGKLDLAASDHLDGAGKVFVWQ